MEENRGLPLSPTVGQTYKTRDGKEYLCIGKDTAHGMIDYVEPGLVGLPNGKFRNVKNGWTFVAKGIVMYADWIIEWGHSMDGQFEPLE